MDIKMEITFSDGSVLNVTELQLKELRSYKMNKGKNQNIDILKIRIVKYLKSSGIAVTSGLIVNRLRFYNNIDVYDLAIKSLVDDGVIKITESTNKYNKTVSRKIDLI